MKSQKILIRNLPEDDGKKRKKIAVKPTTELYCMLLIGFIFFFINKPFALIAFTMILVSVFSLLILPDRTLCEFSNEWMALYNQHNKQECMMIYYEDIVAWQYEWHSAYDIFSICLTDGSTETLEIFGKRRLVKLMNAHVPGKEKKCSRIKR